MARIVSKDNFDRELPGTSDERFVLWPMTQEYALKIVNILNEESGTEGTRFYKVETDDYQLKTFDYNL